MENCLITQLKGSIDNDNVEILGTLTIKVQSLSGSDYETDKSNELQLRTTSTGVTVSVDGDGYFCESTDLVNSPHLTTLDVVATSTANLKKLYFSNGNYKLYITEKSELQGIRLASNGTKRGLFNFGKLEALAGCPVLTDFRDNNDAGLVGDIKCLKGRTLPISLKISNTNVYGRVDEVKIATMEFDNVPLSGDCTAWLENVNSDAVYNIFDTKATEGTVTCDASKASNKVIAISCGNYTKIPFSATWKTQRDTSYPIIAMNPRGTYNYIDFGDDLDAMLINQAQCELRTNPALPAAALYKTINVRGNRTSSSDSAVATLKSKLTAAGGSLVINGVTM